MRTWASGGWKWAGASWAGLGKAIIEVMVNPDYKLEDDYYN